MKHCVDCGDRTTKTRCKPCGYKARKRPSGLRYKIVAQNRGWFKPGEVSYPRKSVPYFDSSTGYMRISIGGIEVKYHRYVMEQHLGKKLTPDELVHHKNKNKIDNRIENLVIMSRGDHMRHHWAERRKIHA